MKRKYSSIAQRQSIRLLTEGSLVRTQLGEFDPVDTIYRIFLFMRK